MNEASKKTAAEEGGNASPGKAQEGQPVGPTAGIVIIVLVLILGGLYFWSKQVAEQKSPEETLQSLPTKEEIGGAADPAAESLKEQSTSDEIPAIEEDLENTNLQGLDAELDDIEGQLENL